MEKSQKNINKIYLFSFFYMFLVFIPVLIPYFMELGLSMEDIFIVQAAFGVTMAICELPSAYIGDLWGRKNILVLGSFINGIGFSLLFWANDFYSLLLYEIVLAIGASFVSGADISLLYDSINGHRIEKAKIISRFQSYLLFGEASASILCSLLMIYGFSYVIGTQVFASWIPFMISLTLYEVPIQRMSKFDHLGNLKKMAKDVFFKTKHLRLLFLNSTIWSLSTFCAVWILQKYWIDSGLNKTHLGLLWASMLLVAALSAFFTPRIEKKYGRKKLLIVMAILPILAYMGMGFIQGIFGILITIFFYISRGLNMVLMKESFNHSIDGQYRNMGNSLLSLCLRLSFFVLGPAIGYCIDKKSMSFALYSLGVLFFILFLLFFMPFLKLEKNELGDLS